MRSRVASLAVVALAAVSCGTQGPAAPAAGPGTRQAAPDGSFQVAATVPPLQLPCTGGACAWIYQDGACQQVAAGLAQPIPGRFTDVRIRGAADGETFSYLQVGETAVTADGETYAITVYENQAVFEWVATRGVRFVVATGVDSNVYVYAPAAVNDSDLVTVAAQPLTQVLFCVEQLGLTVSATAGTGFTRDWAWRIDKSSPTRAVTAELGATVDVAYTVTVSSVPVDAAFVASGTITIQNPSSIDAAEVVIDASLAGSAITPTCTGFDGTIPAQGTLACTWSTNPATPIDASLVVTVSYATEPPPSASSASYRALADGRASDGATVPVSFGGPTASVDSCVLVTDSRAGNLGTLCGAATPAATVFQYTQRVGPYAVCSSEGYAFDNTASFSAPSGETGSSTWSIQVSVPCAAAGCTLTQGYWKTHSQAGPAPHDPRWANVGALEEDTVFFLSGQTWLEVFRTPVRGSAYYALAHQYMAAKLNVLAGASANVLGDALSTAEAFFAANTPAARLTAAQRAELVALAALLDEFNSGGIGPGHCAETERDGGCTNGTSACYDRCIEEKGGHDDALHQQCLERRREGEAKATGFSALCVEPEPDEEELCLQHEQLDRRIGWCVEGCLEECVPASPKPPRPDACGDEQEHQECREHDRKDRRHGCDDRAKHRECRDHDRRDRHHDD